MNSTKSGRNDQCSCGSGKKYKNCCLTNHKAKNPSNISQQAAARAAQTAWTYYQAGRVEQAELLCRQLVEVLPNHDGAWHLMGILALKDGNTSLAIQYLQKALRSSSLNPALYSNMGLALHEQGKLAEAEAHYRKAIAINPRYADAYYNLHALLLEKSDSADAISCLEKALAINPGDIDAKVILGILLDRKGNNFSAKELFNSVLNGPALMQSRLDAWEYIKSQCGKSLPMLGSNISTFKLAFKAARVQGLVMEFGVRHGNTLRQIADLAKQEVHGFDSFEGLPEIWHHEPKGSYTTKGAIPAMPDNVKLHVGWFDNTLPEFLKSSNQPIRFINIDCDIYSSTKTVLDVLAPRVVPGSIIIFDEYIGNEHWREDEFKAFQEAVVKHQWRYEYLSFSIFTKQVTVRIL